MKLKILLMLFMFGITLPAHSNQIFKWTDENGVVHYGDSVPDKYKNKATNESQLKDETPVDEASALEKKEKARAILERGSSSKDSSAKGPQDKVATDNKKKSKKEQCEEQWKEYKESLACFAPFRTVRGGIKAEAFAYCTEVAEPALCE